MKVSGQAETIIQQLVQPSREIENTYSCAFTLNSLAIHAADNGSKELAKSLVDFTFQSTQKIDATHSLKAKVISSIAKVSRQIGDTSQARLLFDLAVENALKIDPMKNRGRAEAFTSIISNLEQNKEIAIPILVQLINNLSITNIPYELDIFQEIAHCITYAGESAKPSLYQLERETRKIDSIYYEASLYSVLAKSATQIGDTIAANLWLDTALKKAYEMNRSFPGSISFSTSTIMSSICLSAREMNKLQARPILEEVANFSLSSEVSDPAAIMIIIDAAESAMQIGDTADAHLWLKTFIENSKDAKYSWFGVSLLEKITLEVTKIGSPLKAGLEGLIKIALGLEPSPSDHQPSSAKSLSSFIEKLAYAIPEVFEFAEANESLLLLMDKVEQLPPQKDGSLSLFSGCYNCKASASKALAHCAARIGNWQQAYDIFQKIPDDELKAEAIILIAQEM